MKELHQIDPDPLRLNPDGLPRLMLAVAVISLLAILSLTSYGIYRVFTWQVVQSAEEDAVNLAEAILATEGKLMLGKTGHREHLSISRQNLDRVDHRLRAFCAPFDIVKIKIYSLDRTIIYSTDPTVIGQVDPNNARLENALAGNYDSRLKRGESPSDLAGEAQFNRDVVETYVPVRDDQRRILGCFEVYRDVTRYRGEIERGVLASTGILGLILTAVFVAAFLVVRQGVRQVRNAQERLAQMASIDPLTGAFNRTEILSRVRKEASRLRRTLDRTPDHAIALVMIDLDRFKAINDRYGHLTGDLVLRQVVRRIKLELRDYDLFGRYGGEEFLAVLPGTEHAAALAVAERMRRAVGNTPLDIEGQSLPITISLGVAVLAGEILDLTGALQQAETALAKAKQSGRDRVCAEDETPDANQ